MNVFSGCWHWRASPLTRDSSGLSARGEGAGRSMRFERDQFYFELLIVGYQFPELADAAYDSNWLNVNIGVKHPEGEWSAVDPALLTYEVNELADWLRAVGAGRREIREMSFLEPCLSFRVRSGDNGTDELAIELA